MKKLWLASLIVLALVVAACGNNSDSNSGNKDSKKMYIPIISKGFQHQFWQAVKLGADNAAKELNVEITFEGPATEQEVDKQLDMLSTALGKDPAAIGFAALDSKAAASLLEEAKSKNIPIVAFDSGVDSDIPVATASTDNIKAAGEAAEQMAKLIGDSGKVAIIVHDLTSTTGVNRVEGFKQAIAANHPNIQIVAVETAQGDPVKSADAAKALLAKYPDLKGFFGANEGSAVGVLNGVKEAGKLDQITIIGYDSGKAQQDAIRAGEMEGAITQNPIGIGYETVKAAVAAAKGESVSKNIDTGYYFYNKDNIDDEKIQAVLYE